MEHVSSARRKHFRGAVDLDEIRMRPTAMKRKKRHPPIPYADEHVRLRDGRKLGFAAFGDPRGKPVFWFHGTPGARNQLPPDAPAAALARGMRIIGVDRPGIGHSTHHAERTFLSFADDVAELADELGVDRFACVGLSGGGPYVLACAHRWPDRVVAGVSLGGIGPTRGEHGAPGYRRLQHVMRAVDRLRGPLGATLSLAVQPLRPLFSPCFELYVRYGPQEDRPVFEREEMKRMFAEDIVSATHQGLRAFVWDVALFSRPWPFSPREITVPIRFFHGDADTIVPLSHSQHLAGLVPDAQLFPMRGLGHFAGFCNVPEVLDQLTALWPKPSWRPSSAAAKPGDAA